MGSVEDPLSSMNQTCCLVCRHKAFTNRKHRGIQAEMSNRNSYNPSVKQTCFPEWKAGEHTSPFLKNNRVAHGMSTWNEKTFSLLFFQSSETFPLQNLSGTWAKYDNEAMQFLFIWWVIAFDRRGLPLTYT